MVRRPAAAAASVQSRGMSLLPTPQRHERKMKWIFGRTGYAEAPTMPRESVIGKTMFALALAAVVGSYYDDQRATSIFSFWQPLDYEKQNNGAGGATTWNRPGHNAEGSVEDGPPTWHGIEGKRYTAVPDGSFFTKPSRWGPAGYLMHMQQLFGKGDAAQ